VVGDMYVLLFVLIGYEVLCWCYYMWWMMCVVVYVVVLLFDVLLFDFDMCFILLYLL